MCLEGLGEVLDEVFREVLGREKMFKTKMLIQGKKPRTTLFLLLFLMFSLFTPSFPLIVPWLFLVFLSFSLVVPYFSYASLWPCDSLIVLCAVLYICLKKKLMRARQTNGR